MNNLEKNNYIILDMLNMQEKLDQTIYDSNDVKYDSQKARLALFDELGEFNHERKKAWCWWKKTQKEIDVDKMFEELIDIWHFALSIYNHEYRSIRKKVELDKYALRILEADKSYVALQCRVARADIGLLEAMVTLTDVAGFTMEEVFEEYKRKNAINYQRNESGY